MIKHAAILHGTSAEPMSGWRPWLKEKLEAEGYEVWVPHLPNNDSPNMKLYNDFLLGNKWDFTNNIVIGHSSGAVSVLNLLSDERCPPIRLAVPVSVWSQGLPIGYEADAFEHMFPTNGYDFEKIRLKAKAFEFIQSDNDPYCPLEQAEDLARRLQAPIKVLHTNYGNNGDHLGSPPSKLPELWSIIEKYI